jgi:hypothetical protein
MAFDQLGIISMTLLIGCAQSRASLHDQLEDVADPTPTVARSPAGEEFTFEELEERGAFQPFPPLALACVLTSAGVESRWRGLGQRVEFYEVYRREVGTQTWNLIAELPGSPSDVESYAYTDGEIGSGAVYEYGVRAIKDTYASDVIFCDSVSVP